MKKFSFFAAIVLCALCAAPGPVRAAEPTATEIRALESARATADAALKSLSIVVQTRTTQLGKADVPAIQTVIKDEEAALPLMKQDALPLLVMAAQSNVIYKWNVVLRTVTTSGAGTPATGPMQLASLADSYVSLGLAMARAIPEDPSFAQSAAADAYWLDQMTMIF